MTHSQEDGRKRGTRDSGRWLQRWIGVKEKERGARDERWVYELQRSREAGDKRGGINMHRHGPSLWRSFDVCCKLEQRRLCHSPSSSLQLPPASSSPRSSSWTFFLFFCFIQIKTQIQCVQARAPDGQRCQSPVHQNPISARSKLITSSRPGLPL